MKPSVPLAVASCLLCSAALLAAQERDSRSALIIGVSTYATRNVPDLPGVKHDMASASAIARAMGIPEGRTTMLLDAQATKAGILRALEALGSSVGDGGRALIYFSGHGTRWYEASVKGCREGLLAYDGEALTNEEIARHTRRIGERADKVIVMIDACHSEGVNSVRGAIRSGYFRPKFFIKDVPTASACEKASNLRVRGLLAENTRLGGLSENFVHITSSRADEASFDEPGKGGLATQGVRDCLLDQVPDVDASGAVTMAEVERCAQRFVDEKLKTSRDLLPHHVTVTGNRNIVPVTVARPPSVAPPAPLAPVATTPPAAEPLAAIPPSVRPPPGASGMSLATLREIAAQGDPRRKVAVTPSRTALRIGRDSLGLNLRSSHDGYVYLVLLGSDGKSFYVLFPNGLDADNRIAANQALTLPRPGWGFVANGPPGTDHLLALVSETPRDLSALSLAKPDTAAPFTYALNDLAGRAALVDFLAGRGVTGASERFGARVLSVKEVP